MISHFYMPASNAATIHDVLMFFRFLYMWELWALLHAPISHADTLLANWAGQLLAKIGQGKPRKFWSKAHCSPRSNGQHKTRRDKHKANIRSAEGTQTYGLAGSCAGHNARQNRAGQHTTNLQIEIIRDKQARRIHRYMHKYIHVSVYTTSMFSFGWSLVDSMSKLPYVIHMRWTAFCFIHRKTTMQYINHINLHPTQVLCCRTDCTHA